jgi:hypothetical protein
MNAKDRASLAEQIISNPLLEVVLNELEHDAIERGIYAQPNDHETRQSAMAEARAVRAFKAALMASLRDTRVAKGAPV